MRMRREDLDTLNIDYSFEDLQKRGTEIWSSIWKGVWDQDDLVEKEQW